MVDEIVRAVVLLIPAVGAAALAIMKLLDSGRTGPRIIGYGFIVVVSAYASYELWDVLKEQFEQSRSARSQARLSPRSYDRPFAEASGGSIKSSNPASGPIEAYAVDDENSALFRMRFDEPNRRYSEIVSWPLDLSGLPESNGRPGVEDLEAAAFGQNGLLYVVSSLSNKKSSGKEDPRRWWLLEIAVPDGDEAPRVLRGTQHLREAIGKTLEKLGSREWLNRRGSNEKMNLEGLAIDEEGLMYMGLRSPLIGDRAVLMRSPAENLLTGGPNELEVFLLDLSVKEGDTDDPADYREHYDSAVHGIVGLEYDRHTKQLVILSNVEHREDWRKPALWTLDPSALPSATPVLCDLGDSDVTSAGKPEAVSIHPVHPPDGLLERLSSFYRGGPNGQITLFYDTGDRPSMYRVLDRYDLCPALYAL